MSKEYYQKNKEWIKEWMRKYREKNRNKVRQYGREWKKKNPEKVKEQRRKYFQKNREKILERKLIYRKKYRTELRRKNREYYKNLRKNPEKRYSRLKRDAKIRKLSFDISYKDFLTIYQKPCIYCGEKEEIGLDRIDNNRGYAIDNVVPACPTCNYFRGRLVQKDFINQCKKITNYQLKNPAPKTKK